MIGRRGLILGGVAALAAMGTGSAVLVGQWPASRRWVAAVIRDHLAEGGLVAVDLDRFVDDFLQLEATWKLEAFAATAPVFGQVPVLERRFEQRIADKRRVIISYFVLSSDLVDPARTGATVRYFGLTSGICQGANPFARQIDAAAPHHS